MADREDPSDQTELFVAFAAPVGVDLDQITAQMQTALREYGFGSDVIRLSNYLGEESGVDYAELPFDEAVSKAMWAGDGLRGRWGRNDALALRAISEVVALRDACAASLPDDEFAPNLNRHAFLFRSLKTPDELSTLRAVYGSRLVVFAAYSPRDQRLDYLRRRITDSRNNADQSSWAHLPEELMDRDEKEELVGGQNLGDTFHRADFFIRGWDRHVVEEDLSRSLEILFGSPFRTPTRDEQGQFLAAGAARRSAEMGRQVGAALTTAGGEVIAVGTNEVPVSGGGSHWEEDGKGNRDFEIGEFDTNRAQFDALADRLRDAVATRLEDEIEKLGCSDSEIAPQLEQLAERFRTVVPKDLRSAGLKDLTEFGRASHAEMNALLDAARRGISVEGATLHSTTFPCHNCARHLIGAGVSRIVFIEPYPKSRADVLHGDSLSIDTGQADELGSAIRIESFVGVAPRRYLELFDAEGRALEGHVARKDGSGHLLPFMKKTAWPIFRDTGLAPFRVELREYRSRELLALDHYERNAGTDPSGRSGSIGGSESDGDTLDYGHA